MSKNTQELVALTSLRGVAAIMVLVSHYALVFTEDFARWMPSKILSNSYLFVDLFFILSGFVLAYVYQDFTAGVTRTQYKEYLIARVARIFPLHWFTLAIVFVLELVSLFIWHQYPAVQSHWAQPFTESQSLITLFSNLIMLQTFHWDAYWNVPAWSLSAEFSAYLWLPCLIFYLRDYGVKRDIAVSLVALAILLAIEVHYGDLGYAFAGWPQIFRAGADAALGVVAWNCYRFNMLPRFSGRYLLAFLAATFFVMALPVPAICVIPFFALLVLIAARNQESPCPLLHHPISVFFGRISFGLYLIHWILFDLLRQGSLAISGLGFGAKLNLGEEIAVFAALFSLCCILATLLHYGIEKPARTFVLWRWSDKAKK